MWYSRCCHHTIARECPWSIGRVSSMLLKALVSLRSVKHVGSTIVRRGEVCGLTLHFLNEFLRGIFLFILKFELIANLVIFRREWGGLVKLREDLPSVVEIPNCEILHVPDLAEFFQALRPLVEIETYSTHEQSNDSWYRYVDYKHSIFGLRLFCRAIIITPWNRRDRGRRCRSWYWRCWRRRCCRRCTRWRCWLWSLGWWWSRGWRHSGCSICRIRSSLILCGVWCRWHCCRRVSSGIGLILLMMSFCAIGCCRIWLCWVRRGCKVSRVLRCSWRLWCDSTIVCCQRRIINRNRVIWSWNTTIANISRRRCILSNWIRNVLLCLVTVCIAVCYILVLSSWIGLGLIVSSSCVLRGVSTTRICRRVGRVTQVAAGVVARLVATRIPRRGSLVCHWCRVFRFCLIRCGCRIQSLIRLSSCV